MSTQFAQANDASRARLTALVEALTEEQLQRPLPYAGTVAGLLAHLAFFERRVTVLLRRWQTNGVAESPMDPDMINDALLPFWAVLEPRAAARLCLAAAAEADATIEEVLTPELLAAIEASGTFFRPDRSLHREGHMKDIEAVLAG